MNTRRYIVILTAAVAPFATWCAMAGPPAPGDAAPMMVVSLAGYDLTSEQGVDALYRRIESAAEVVCRVGYSREQQRVGRASACYRSAVNDAVAQVDRPLLSAAHARALGKTDKGVLAASR